MQKKVKNFAKKKSKIIFQKKIKKKQKCKKMQKKAGGVVYDSKKNIKIM